MSIERPQPTETRFLNPAFLVAQSVLTFELDTRQPFPQSASEINPNIVAKVMKGEPAMGFKIGLSSLNERQDYWSRPDNPSKDLSPEEQMSRWTARMDRFLGKFKDKPEAEFLKAIGVDLQAGSAARSLHREYLQDEANGVNKFVAKVTSASTIEQIEQNQALIKELVKIFGLETGQAVELMIQGVKNAQTDLDGFIKAAHQATGQRPAATPPPPDQQPAPTPPRSPEPSPQPVAVAARPAPAQPARAAQPPPRPAAPAAPAARTPEPARPQAPEVVRITHPDHLVDQVNHRLEAAQSGPINFEISPQLLPQFLETIPAVKGKIRDGGLHISVKPDSRGQNSIIALGGTIGERFGGVKFRDLQVASDGRNGLRILNLDNLEYYGAGSLKKDEIEAIFAQLNEKLNRQLQGQIRAANCRVVGLTIEGDQLVLKISKS